MWYYLLENLILEFYTQLDNGWPQSNWLLPDYHFQFTLILRLILDYSEATLSLFWGSSDTSLKLLWDYYETTLRPWDNFDTTTLKLFCD